MAIVLREREFMADKLHDGLGDHFFWSAHGFQL
jgi:hypothetical protein